MSEQTFYWWCDNCERGLYDIDAESNSPLNIAIDGDEGYSLCPTCGNRLDGFNSEDRG